jgi:hypothetical protein
MEILVWNPAVEISSRNLLVLCIIVHSLIILTCFAKGPEVERPAVRPTELSISSSMHLGQVKR